MSYECMELIVFSYMFKFFHNKELKEKKITHTSCSRRTEGRENWVLESERRLLESNKMTDVVLSHVSIMTQEESLQKHNFCTERAKSFNSLKVLMAGLET